MVDTARLTNRDRLALGISFLVLAGCGGVYVAHTWLARNSPVDAFLRSATLVASVLAMHLIGLNELRWQHRRPLMRLADRVRLNAHRLRANAPLGLILLSQVVFVLFASLLVDGGDILKVSVGSAAVFWGIVGCGLLWRTRRLNRLDHQLIRYGFFALIPVIAVSWSIVLQLNFGHGLI